jgi:PLP dependent protein
LLLLPENFLNENRKFFIAYLIDFTFLLIDILYLKSNEFFHNDTINNNLYPYLFLSTRKITLHPMINLLKYQRILSELKPFNAQLVAVSKTKPVEAIKELQGHGQHIFGENYVQELLEKAMKVDDVDWHFIGHLQSNKVKNILPVTKLIHGVDSLKLLVEINKQAAKQNTMAHCLLQIYIASEDTKFGLSFEEADEFFNGSLLPDMKNIYIKGFMGMASNTEDNDLIRTEFKTLRKFFDKHKSHGLDTLSMGMTSDYMIALNEGSNMVRIGSAIFGSRI